MKISISFILLVSSALAQVPQPQINLTGNIGCQGFPCLNSGSLQFTSDADRNMTAQETSATGGIKVTSTLPLTATRNLILPTGRFQFIAIENATTGSQSIRVIGQSGTGITIVNGQTVGVWFDGTNVVQTSVPGAGITLQTNGTNNGSQSTLNIAAGSNITASNTGGTVTISGPTPYSLGVGVGNGNLTLGAGAGTGATGSLTGTAGNMQLTINAGTTPTIGGIIATINITAGRPSFCVYSSNTNRISAITTSISGASMEVDDNSTAGLTGLATYIWNISCP